MGEGELKVEKSKLKEGRDDANCSGNPDDIGWVVVR